MGRLEDLAARYGLGGDEPAPAPAASKLDELAARYGIDSQTAPTSAPAEPGVLDRAKDVAMGFGTMATNALDKASFGLYRKARDAASNLVSPGSGTATTNAEQQFNAQHPYLEGTSNAIGYLLPGGAPSRLAEATSAGLRSVTEAAPGLAQRILAARPVASALAGGISNAGTSAAEDVVAGRPLPEIGQNALASGLTGAATGGVLGLGASALNNLVDNARPRATKDIAKDITAAEGVRARVTDQKRIAEVNERLFKLTQDNEQLRGIWRQPAEKALPKLAEIKRQVAEPLDGLYKSVDAQTGGISLRSVVDGFESAAQQAESKASGQGQAAILRSVAQDFMSAYGKGGFDPKKVINADGVTAGDQIAMLEKAKARGAPVDDEIARVKQLAAAPDLDKKIPTARFREEVTDLSKTAQRAMGGYEGTARHESLDHLYRVGKGVIDAHLDSSGIDPGELATLRKANDQYFLLSRAEAAIESRGWKESNRPTGFAHSAAQAVHSGSLPAMAAFAALHPHSIPAIAATYGTMKAAPALASRLNWALANLPPGSVNQTADPAAIARIVQALNARTQEQP